MRREQISRLAHTDHPIAAPLDDESVRRLLERAVPHPGARLLDLGCGGAEWLLRALTRFPRLRAVGVDLSEEALAHAAHAARRLGVHDRLVLHRADAADFCSSSLSSSSATSSSSESSSSSASSASSSSSSSASSSRSSRLFDLVLCVGATHAFGGLPGALAAARRHLAPGGRVLVGEGFWSGEPSPEAVGMLGDLADLPATLDRVSAGGWTPVHGHISTREELDAYEWAWTGSLASWALDHPGHPDSARALAAADEHRAGWLRGYRDVFGFVCLVLRPTPG